MAQLQWARTLDFSAKFAEERMNCGYHISVDPLLQGKNSGIGNQTYPKATHDTARCDGTSNVMSSFRPLLQKSPFVSQL